MKVIYALLLVAVVIGAYISWRSIDQDFRSDVSLISYTNGLKKEFRESHKEVLTFSFEEIVRSKPSDELVDPQLTLPQVHRYPLEEISQLFQFAENCKGRDRKTRDRNLEKAWQWHEFACGKSNLPKDFFSRAPFMHPSGRSYALLAKQDLKYLHVREQVNQIGISGTQLDLSAAELKYLLNGEEFVLGKKFVYANLRTVNGYATTIRYEVYLRPDWEAFISKKRLLASEKVDTPTCLYRESNFCWTQNQTQATRISKIFIVGLLSLSALLIIILAFIMVRGVQQKRRENAQRLFALQMLTHELRTPATALNLLVETFRHEFDSLPEKSQHAFLLMCEELQKLDRVIEASKSYLNSSERIDMSRVAVSVNHLIEGIVERFAKVEFVPLANDCKIKTDRYWLELCIRNLVENALKHGLPPVTVRLSVEGNQIIIAVVDGGKVSFSSLNEMMKPFCKSPRSHGLGLGLSIVSNVAKKINAELEFASSPTTFSVRIKELI